MNYYKIVEDIIKSDTFRNELMNINKLFFNLKQERHIRDLLLKELTKILNNTSDDNYLVISEYPRGKSGQAVDLSIVSKKDTNDIYLIEIKYHYPGDFNNNDNVNDILKDIESTKSGRSVDLFILIIQDWIADISRFNEFLKEWRLDVNLAIHQKDTFDLNKLCSKIKRPYKDIINYPINIYSPMDSIYKFYLFVF